MLWESWLATIAPSLNVTNAQAGVIMAFIFTWGFVTISILGAPDYASYGAPLSALLGILLFTYAGWFPRWTGAALALTISLAVVVAMTSSSSGGKKR